MKVNTELVKNVHAVQVCAEHSKHPRQVFGSDELSASLFTMCKLLWPTLNFQTLSSPVSGCMYAFSIKWCPTLMCLHSL